MTQLTNSLEGGTSGTTVSSANSGGTSGDALNTVSIGGTGTLTFDNTHAAHGSLAMECTTSAGSFSFGYYGTSLGAGQGQVWFRVYLYITGAPAANSRLVTFWQTTSATTQCAALLMNNGGKIIFQNAVSGTILTSASTYPTNAWFRVEGYVIPSATVGQLEFKIFTSMDSTTAADTQTSGATQNTAASIGSVGFGVSNSPASAVSAFWMDDLGVSNVAYIGPAGGINRTSTLSGSGTLGGAETLGIQAAMSGSGTLAGFSGLGQATLSGSGTLAALAQLSLRSAQTVTTGTGNTTLSVPAQQCAVGDLILIWVAVGFPAITFTSAGGDSLTAEAANSPATTPQMSTQLFHKIADSSDVAKAAASGSYVITSSVTHAWSGTIAVVPVTSTAHPFDPSDTPGSGQTNAAGTSATAASITTTTNYELLLWLGAVRNTGGATPPTMTVPSGYLAPTGVTQANSSGAATSNAGVMLAIATQYAAQTTGTVSGTYTGSQVSAGLLLAIKAAPVIPLAGIVAQLVGGAPTSSGFQVVAKTENATSVRLAYSTHSDMSSPSFVAAQTPDSLGYVRYTASSLSSATQYYYQLMDTPTGGAETAIGAIGQCRTLPAAGSAQSFTVALVSCIAEQDSTTPPVFDAAMSDWNSYNADLNIFTGDFNYSGTQSTDTPTQVGIYEQQIQTYAQLGTMVSDHWGYYCRSDHEAGPDNGDSNNAYTATNIAAAQQVFPFGTLGDQTNSPPHGLYQSWVVGRVRFIMIDIRNTDRSPGGNTDNGSKTMLGALQLAWLESQLIQSEPLKVIISDVAWMGPASIVNGPDKWWSYDTERQAIISYIAANAAQVQGLMLWHGDSHLVGCTPANSNAYGGFSVYCAAPMLNVGGGLNTSTFTNFYNNSSGECRQYGRISITDTGTKITVDFKGWDAVNAVAQVEQIDVFETPATLSGSGTLAGAPAFRATAALSGTGTLAAAETLGIQAALSGTGTLAAAPVKGFVGAAALTGSGTLSAAPVKGFASSAALSGTGTLSAAETLGIQAALSGSGTLAAVVPLSINAALSGSGTLLASLTLLNNAEGGSNGTTVTTGNSGGASGNAFDSISLGTGAALTFDNTHAAHGTLGYKVSTAGTVTTSLAEWTTTGGTQTTIYYRMYCYIPGGELPTAAWRPFSARVSGGGHAGSVLFTQAGTMQICFGAGFSSTATFNNPPPTDQWFRIEGFITGDASAGAISCSLFQSMDSRVPIETKTGTSLNTTGLLTQYWFGQSNSSANSGPFWFDDVGTSPTGFLGPVGDVPGISLQNSAEGSTNGTTVTSVLSGNRYAGSGFDSVNIGALAALTFDNAHVAHGNLAYNFTVGSPAANSFLTWTNALTGPVAQPQVWFRAYIYQTAYSTNQLRIVSNRTGATYQGGPALTSTGKVVLLNASGGTIKTSTTTVPLNQYWRLEGYIIGDPSVGQLEVKIFTTNADSPVPDETLTTTAAQNTGAPLNRIDFGNPSSQATYTFWMDEVGASTQGYMGPAGFEASLTGSGTLSASEIQSGAATLAGSGTLSAAPVLPGAATLSGTGTLTGSPVLQETATLSGSGVLGVVSGQVGAAALSGTGTLAAGAVQGVQAVLSGTGTLTAAITVGSPVTLTGSGTLSAAETLGIQAPLSGTGTLAAGATLPATAVLSGTGSLTASPARSGAATLSGLGTLAALWKMGEQSAMSGLGTLLASPSFPRVSVMSGTGTLAATQSAAVVQAQGDASVTPFADGTTSVISPQSTSTYGTVYKPVYNLAPTPSSTSVTPAASGTSSVT